MAILNRAWYNALVDDAGNGLTGTIWNKAQIAGLLDSIDAALGPLGPPQPPGGASSQVQFNDANAFAGDAGLTFNKTTKELTANVLIANYLSILNNGSVNGSFNVGSLLSWLDATIKGKAIVEGGALVLGTDPAEGGGSGAIIRRNTADGADTGYIVLAGGGAGSDVNRGGRAVVFGNESGAPGSVVLYTGDVPTAIIALKDHLGNSALEFRNDTKTLILKRPAVQVGAVPAFDGPTTNLTFDLATGAAFLSPGTSGPFNVKFINPPPTGVEYVCSIQFDIAAAIGAVTYPAGTTWDSDIAPVFPGAGRSIILGFSTINGGTRWRGYVGGSNFAT
jgi:hypothetical protein